MKITLEIKDNKADFFMELLGNLDFVQVETDDNFVLTDTHKKILDERLLEYENEKDNPPIEWDDIERELRAEYGL